MKKQHLIFLFVAFFAVIVAGLTMTRCNPLGNDPVSDIAATVSKDPDYCGQAQEYLLVDATGQRYGKATVSNSEKFLFVKAEVGPEYSISKMTVAIGYDPAYPSLEPNSREVEFDNESNSKTIEFALNQGQLAIDAKEFMTLSLEITPANTSREGRPVEVFVEGKVDIGKTKAFTYIMQSCKQSVGNLSDVGNTDRPEPNPSDPGMILCGETQAYMLTTAQKQNETFSLGTATFMNSLEELAVKINIDKKYRIIDAFLYYGYDPNDVTATERPLVVKARPTESNTQMVIKVDRNLNQPEKFVLDDKQYFSLLVNVTRGEKDMLPASQELFVEGEYLITDRQVFSYQFQPCTGGTQVGNGVSTK